MNSEWTVGEFGGLYWLVGPGGHVVGTPDKKRKNVERRAREHNQLEYDANRAMHQQRVISDFFRNHGLGT